MKLTDSSLKAIEDFIRLNSTNNTCKPKIQFLPNNEGKIIIPYYNGSQLCEHVFRFSNNNTEMEGQQGSWECFRSSAPRRLESCGALSRRIRVHANDDSYEATKDRMARTVAAEQSKCTRVIKPNQTDIGRRVKVRSSHSLPYSSNSVSAPHPVVPPPALRPVAHPPPAPPQHQPQQPPQRMPGNPELARRSIKERLIQLLALKPFKKPELYSRLTSEGLKDKERTVMNKILPQIGTLKDNCYHIRRHVWNDVNEDWPFYTEEEKRTLKRRKPQNLTPPGSSDSTNSLSPRGSPSSIKRAGGAGVAGGDDVPSKKQRISHYRRPEHAALGGSPSSGYATAGSGASSGERHASDNEDDRSVKKENGYTLSYNTVKDLCPSPAKSNGYGNSPPVEQNRITEKDTKYETLENNELSSPPDENMTDLEEIERQYPPISSSSSRRAYKDEFSMLYNEYRSLHTRLAPVAKLFSRLERELQDATPQTPHHQSIEQRIVEEYRRRRNDTAYQRDRRRVDYLHLKLQRIKQMVYQYDNLFQHNVKPERINTASTTQAY